MPQFSGEHRHVSAVDVICRENNRRRVKEFFNYGSAQATADMLQASQRVMLLTGFCVKQEDGRPIAETDGPAGTVMLAKTLAEAGKDIVLVADQEKVRILFNILDNANSVSQDIIKKIDVVVWASGQQVEDVFNGISPDIVGAIEVPGRNQDGVYCNMSGDPIGSFNVDLDSLLIEARMRGVKTFAIGDGGNEAGMAGLRRLNQLEPSHFVSVVPSDMPVTAWNSNLGAMAVAGCFNARGGNKPIDPGLYKEAVELSVAAGAIDGVTKRAEASVDGVKMDMHLKDIVALNDALDLH